MRIRLALALFAVVVYAVVLRASTFETVTVSSTSIGLAAATTKGMATCTARLAVAQVRWRSDGTAPSTTVGTLMEIGDVMTIANILDAQSIRFIRTGSTDGVLSVSCFPQQ